MEKNKWFEVIIDLGSKTFMIKANNKQEAEQLAINEFEALKDTEKIEEYWVGECNEVE